MDLSEIDEVDRKIVAALLSGFKSYEDLAKKIGKSRSTVYRRIKNLKENDFLNENLILLPNFDNLDYTFITVGLSTSIGDVDRVIDLLVEKEEVVMVWEAFGDYDILFIVISDNKNNGKNIKKIKKELFDEKIEINDFHISASTTIHKIDFGFIF